MMVRNQQQDLILGAIQSNIKNILQDTETSQNFRHIDQQIQT